MDTKRLSRYLPKPLLERKVRGLAVDRVHRDMVLHQKTEADYSDQDLEFLLADAEREIWSSIKGNSLKLALVLLGVSWL
jgi:hypothetical protein